MHALSLSLYIASGNPRDIQPVAKGNLRSEYGLKKGTQMSEIWPYLLLCSEAKHIWEES